MTDTATRWALPLALAAALLGLWQAAVVIGNVPAYLVPSPLDVARTLVADWALLAPAWWNTVRITLLAFAVAVLLGVAVAFLMVQSRWIETALFPYAVLLQVTPIVAIAPLIIIWVQDTTLSLVICASIVALFPVVANTSIGLRSVSPALAAYFRLQGASRWQTLVRLRLPSALPYFFTGLRVAAGLALIGAVVAEFVAGTGGSQTGLAYQILQAGYQLNIPRMFAALVLVSVTGVGGFALVALAARACLAGWHDSELSGDARSG
jgi:NitT/TauT family transport system permease protein